MKNFRNSIKNSISHFTMGLQARDERVRRVRTENARKLQIAEGKCVCTICVNARSFADWKARFNIGD